MKIIITENQLSSVILPYLNRKNISEQISPTSAGGYMVTPTSPGVSGTYPEQSPALDIDETDSQIWLDILGILDPSPVTDTVNATIYAKQGEYLFAALSLISAFPYVGDLVGKSLILTIKGLRAAIKVGTNAIKDIAKGVPTLEGIITIFSRLKNLSKRALKSFAQAIEWLFTTGLDFILNKFESAVKWLKDLKLKGFWRLLNTIKTPSTKIILKSYDIFVNKYVNNMRNSVVTFFGAIKKMWNDIKLPVKKAAKGEDDWVFPSTKSAVTGAKFTRYVATAEEKVDWVKTFYNIIDPKLTDVNIPTVFRDLENVRELGKIRSKINSGVNWMFRTPGKVRRWFSTSKLKSAVFGLKVFLRWVDKFTDEETLPGVSFNFVGDKEVDKDNLFEKTSTWLINKLSDGDPATTQSFIDHVNSPEGQEAIDSDFGSNDEFYKELERQNKEAEKESEKWDKIK